MTFDFDACRDVLFTGLLAALTKNRKRLRDLRKIEEIWAISYDVIPWDPYIGVACRLLSESNSLDALKPGGWKHSHFLDNPKELLPAKA